MFWEGLAEFDELRVWWMGTLGLLIGSFLNVVIFRLPKIIEREWLADCAQLQSERALANAEPCPCADKAPRPENTAPFSLSQPASACPACGHQVRWFENIPVISYLFLRGRCSGCGVRISLRYPAVELLTCGLFVFCASQPTLPAALAWCGFSAAIVALGFIDWDTTLLPDIITMPLTWAGIGAALMHWTSVPLADSVLGAMGGYLSLWLVYWAFKLATGKEGMGFGDFKLFAALGAWFGWQALVPIILMASVIGTVIGIALKVKQNLREGGYVPFGPFLALAGLTAMIAGPQAMLTRMLSLLGM